MTVKPALVVHFLASDAGLSVGSIQVWAETVGRSAGMFEKTTIAVVDVVAERPRRVRIDDLRELCQAHSVEFRHVSVSTATTLAEVSADLCREVDDLLLMADAADVPSPRLLARMFADLERPDVAIIDAHPLPLAPPDQASKDGAWAPAGVCVLLSRSTCAELGDFPMSSSRGDIRRLLEAAKRHNKLVVGTRRATIFRDVRVTSTQTPIATRYHPPGPPAVVAGPAEIPGQSHPAKLPTTSLGEVIRDSGVEALIGTGSENGSAATCFLTVLTRTQGLRPQCLEEALLCLSAQTVRDFEVILACHQLTEASMRQTAEILAGFPAWFRARVRTIEVDRAGRTAPLNDALGAANGRYAAILDDDDLVLAHWVETFMRLEQRSQGRMLRAVALRQDIDRTEHAGHMTATAVGPPWCEWPLSFELVDHLVANFTPCLSVAFPCGVFRDLGFRFDEAMLVTEDWEYLVRTAAIVGVESDSEVTSVYRWWRDGESSRTAQTMGDWSEARERVQTTLDQRVLLMPQGSAARIRSLFEERTLAWTELTKVREVHEALIANVAELRTAHDELSTQHWPLVAAYHETVARAENAEAKALKLRRRLQRQQRQAKRALARASEERKVTSYSLGDVRRAVSRLTARARTGVSGWRGRNK